MLQFPSGFLWGVATAAHQVEGGNTNNDWWEWEQVPGHIKNDDSSARASDWWKGERYREDLDLAHSLSLNGLRISVEWSRLEPREGEWDAGAFAYYRRILTAARERGITPLVTLHHFSNPCWLVEKGGWGNQAVVPLFERFAERVVKELGDLCGFWVTINEPVVLLYTGYVRGYWPPGKQDFSLAMRAGANMLRAHAASFQAFHHAQPNAQVGFAHNIHVFRPANPRSWSDKLVARLQDIVYNKLVLNSLSDGWLRFPMGTGKVEGLAGAQDFLGLNFYFSTRVSADRSRPNELFGRQLPARPWGVPYDDELLEWWGKGDIDPEGFYDTLMSLRQFGKPVYVTENGICDRNDELRARFLIHYLAALHRAIREGAPVKGYFHWTLVDNFEWAEGYSLRFGLVHVDFDSQQRTIKPSAHVYAQIARENAISDILLQEYGAG